MLGIKITGGELYEAIQEGVRQGYKEGYLRKSIVGDPLRRRNTSDNTPAVIHTTVVTGDGLKIIVAPKGGGSENMSEVRMLVPAQGIAKTPITILGAGFKPGEEIMVEMLCEGTCFGLGYREKVDGERKRKHFADENGTVRVISTIPRAGASSPGVWPIIATGNKGSKALCPFEILE